MSTGSSLSVSSDPHQVTRHRFRMRLVKVCLCAAQRPRIGHIDLVAHIAEDPSPQTTRLAENAVRPPS